MPGPDWLHFPSLTALRAFEATARLQGVSAAARALNVTHAAVVQQVRALEHELGCELAFRDGRGLKLTAEGERLAQALGEGFRSIEAALAELRGQDGAPLKISLTPAFAAQWLVPRLGAFWAEHPEIALTLLPEQRLTDLRRESVDLAIRFGDGRWPGVDSEFLTPAHYVIVAAPSLLAGRSSLSHAEMSAMPWVIEQDWPEVQAWLRGFGLSPDEMEITLMPNEELALSAARQGYGLHVEAAALVEQDLAAGHLVALGELADDSLAYYLVTRPGPRRPELRSFIRWLKAQLAPVRSADRPATSRP
jgi:LysR family glycine cleavage system transcriptional activator